MTTEIKAEPSMSAQMGATAVTSFISGIMDSHAQAKQARRARDARALSDSAASKASGFETIQANQRTTENAATQFRQSLRIQGSNRASADSAGVTGGSVNARDVDISMQIGNAMAIADRNAENAISADKLTRKNRFEAATYTVETFSVPSLGQIALKAGLDTANSAAKMAGGG
jgi:hypothetical protein